MLDAPSTMPSPALMQAAQLRRLASLAYDRGLYIDARVIFRDADMLESVAAWSQSR